MKNSVGRIIVLVQDYDEAAKFYELNFGFSRLVDYTTKEGQRFLHVGNSDGIGIWFLKSSSELNRIGNQTAGEPLMVIYTTSIQSLYSHLITNGVQIKGQIVKTADSQFFHCFDLYGNELICVELSK